MNARDWIRQGLAHVAMALVCLMAGDEVLAQSSPQETITQALSGEASAAGAALASRGAKVERVLVLDALPRGGVAAEVAIAFRGKRARFPVKLSRDTSAACATWRVVWSPDEAYITALLNMLASGSLPESVASPAWVDARRLPALPVIVTRQRLITPYGSMTTQQGAPTPAGAGMLPTPATRLTPPAPLSAHVKRWMREYLEEDPGAAAVDLIVDARATWRDLTRVIFGASSQGFYKLYLVTRQGDGLAAIETAAPIFGKLPGVAKPVPLVLAYASIGEGRASFRVSQGRAILKDPEACAPGASLCAASPQAFGDALNALATRMRDKDSENLSHAMFATTGEVSLGEALRWLERAGPGLGIAQRRVFIGYIEREASR